jgi:hypothetical protein
VDAHHHVKLLPEHLWKGNTVNDMNPADIAAMEDFREKYVEDIWDTNQKVAAILRDAVQQLGRLNLDDASLSPGYDLADIVAQIKDMTPTCTQAQYAQLSQDASDKWRAET